MGCFLQIIGGVACIVALGTLVIIGFNWLGAFIDERKRAYRIKHRFDKPPLAKCHCIDCESYGKDDGKCYRHSGWYVADSWFCWAATPSKAVK